MSDTRILVLDGDAKTRSETAQLFADLGYVVQAAGSAGEAVAMLEKAQVGCAVVDVELEDVPAVEAIALLRRVDPQLRIVVTARESKKDVEAQVRQQEITYYHVKSFDRQELTQAVARAVAARSKTDKKDRILVVDDDRDYQAATRQILENAGYEVLSAYTKEEGLAALKEAAPDLVILDIMMTKVTDGFFFLYEMKAKDEGTQPPVLSVSVISKETGFKFSPTKDGDYFPADDYLVKPVEPGELLAHVEALLGGYRPAKSGE